MKEPKPSKFGTCRLTGKHGKFVKSHIIPRALTKSEVAGEPRWQAGQGRAVSKRFDSWYDPQLCTQAGEDILAAIDGAAITELRRCKLVWSGWEGAQTLGSEHQQLGDTPHGIRKLEKIDLGLLRRFFLSLLWRTAASERWEFGEVQIPDADLSQMRDLILSGDPGPIDFYPISLTQLSTVGPSHNLTPILMTKEMPEIEDCPARSVDLIRFYFEGLIAHIHRHNSDNGETSGMGPLVVGGAGNLIVPTVTFEASFQAENLFAIMSTAIQENDLDGNSVP